MGGAIVASFLEKSPLADRVSGLVFDSPALKLGAMVDARAADTALPLLPFRVPAPLTAGAKLVASWRFGIDWDEIDYLERIGSIRVPVLLFHGSADGTVPVWISDVAAERLGDLATYVRVDGADHVRAWNVDRSRYEAAIDEFLARIAG
jgi:pimeloyl-ACP methyl ester carboxylesterase